MTKAELELAKKRFKFADEADKNQRTREKDDLGFYEGETQWPEDIKTLRAGQQAQNSMPAVPARPCLTINKIRDPIRKIQNDELQADLGISIVPADDFGGDIDEDEIELREGLARRIQRQSNAKDARMWAANRAAISGRGWYGITVRDVDSDDTLDQEIVYVRYYDQFSVLPDPTHEQPDGSDMEWCFVGRDVPWDIYREEYEYLANGKKNPLAKSNISDQEWRAYADEAPLWIKQDGENRSVRVTEYWRYDRERYQLVAMSDGSVVRFDALPADVQDTTPREALRDRVKKRVKFSVIDGTNELEATDWLGKFIPIIKVVGEEMHVFDQERRCEGLVRPARDAQKSYNVMVSTAVETIGLAPKAPVRLAAGSIENFENMWQQAAVRNWPYLLYNAFDPATGQPIPPPQDRTNEPPIQAMAMMMQTFDQGIMATIGQANLADTHPDVRSGAMASTLLDEAARGTSNYLANLIRSSHREGDILNDLFYPIYGKRDGRIVSMMSGAQKTQRVVIGQPSIPSPDGRAMPQPAHPGDPGAKTYRLSPDGSFNVAIEVSKFYETKKQEKTALMVGIIEKSPEQLAIIGDLVMGAIGDEDMAKRYRAVLAPPIQQMLQEGQPVDPRLAQAMQMGQQLALEMQQLKADKHARIEQAQIKAISDATTTDHDNQTKIQIAQSHDATLLLIEEMKTKFAEQDKALQYLMDAEEKRQEAARTQEKFMEERRLSDEQRGHEHEVAHHDRAHELAMSVVEHQHAKDALEHEAAVMPKPTSNGSGE